MTPKTYEITVRKVLLAPLESIWPAFTEAEAWCAVHGAHRADIDFREGGTIRVEFWPDREGGETFVITEIDGIRRLGFHWEGHPDQAVTLTLEPTLDGTEVSLSQACGGDLDWIANCLDGWAWIVDSLEHWLETGKAIPNEEWSREFGTHSIVRREAEGDD